MGFVDKLLGKQHSESQKAAVDAVYDLLDGDNSRADRKEKDVVEATPQSVIITHWGVQAEEASRKQELAKESLAAAGITFQENAVQQHGRELIGAAQGSIIIDAAENGGFSAIADKADALRLDSAHDKGVGKGHAAKLDAQRGEAKSAVRAGRS